MWISRKQVKQAEQQQLQEAITKLAYEIAALRTDIKVLHDSRRQFENRVWSLERYIGVRFDACPRHVDREEGVHAIAGGQET